MRLIVVNVNTSHTISEAIHAQALRHAAPDTRIETLTPFFGPRAVEDDFESHLSAVAVIDRMCAVEGEFDAVIEAGFGENARPGLQAMLPVPVIGITDAAALTASLLGRKFSVVTTVSTAVPQIEERLQVSGLLSRCASIRATELGVLDIDNDPARAVAALTEQARLAVRDDGADVICLGCAGMVGLEDEVGAAIPVPVVEGVSAAVKLAESLYSLGLRPRSDSGWNRSRSPRSHWPLHDHLRGLEDVTRLTVSGNERTAGPSAR